MAFSFATSPTLPRSRAAIETRRKILALGQRRGWFAACQDEHISFTAVHAESGDSERGNVCLSSPTKCKKTTSPSKRTRVPEIVRAAFTSGALPLVAHLPPTPSQSMVDSLADVLDKSLVLNPLIIGSDISRIRGLIGVESDENDSPCIEDDDELRGRQLRLKGEEVWLGNLCFHANKEVVSQRLLQYFDDIVLHGRLGSAVTIRWNNRLSRTAGLTCMKKQQSSGVRTAVIELSTKVLDEPERLYNTLAHELCHAAAWIIDNCARPPHGREFKAWTSVFHKWDRALVITTCHEYKIRYRYAYVCTECNHEYGRHSKSIDISRHVCGKCKSSLRLEDRKPSSSRKTPLKR